MSVTVAHFTDKYGVTGENYICEQVAMLSRYRGKLFAERRVISKFNPVPDAVCFAAAFNRPVLNRAYEAVTKRFASSLYETLLNRFYAERLSGLGAGIIHAHFGTTACRVLPMKRKLNVPFIVTFYGNDISETLRSPRWVGRYQKLFAEADRFVVLFDEGVDRLSRIGCPREKIAVWDIGIPIAEYPYQERKFSGPTLQILTAARFVEKKGYWVLLEAFARLFRRRPNIRLKIIGYGPLRPAIVAKIAEQGLADVVTLVDTGGRSDFFELFKTALVESHIFVLPSIVAPNGDDEGGPPVVITNAMSSGLPIVATAVGGITRAIVHEQTGLISESGSADSLERSIERLIVDPGWAVQLARNARQRCETNFDLHRQLQKLEAIYDDLVARR